MTDTDQQAPASGLEYPSVTTQRVEANGIKYAYRDLGEGDLEATAMADATVTRNLGDMGGFDFTTGTERTGRASSPGH
jgi:hypothetical protein